jgi:hypothetical protein
MIVRITNEDVYVVDHGWEQSSLNRITYVQLWHDYDWSSDLKEWKRCEKEFPNGDV